jgi:hypothetical protein
VAARVVRRGVDHVNFGFVVGVPLLALALLMNILKLVLNLVYWYQHAEVQIAGVDPVTGFALGLALIWIVGYLLNGARQRSVWAALGLAVAMPLLYVVMVDGLAAAIVHEQTYFEQHWRSSLWIEVAPACVLAMTYGLQALANYHQRFRRLG